MIENEVVLQQKEVKEKMTGGKEEEKGVENEVENEVEKGGGKEVENGEIEEKKGREKGVETEMNAKGNEEGKKIEGVKKNGVTTVRGKRGGNEEDEMKRKEVRNLFVFPFPHFAFDLFLS